MLWQYKQTNKQNKYIEIEIVKESCKYHIVKKK